MHALLQMDRSIREWWGAPRAVVETAQRETRAIVVGDVRGERIINPSTWPPHVGLWIEGANADLEVLNATFECHTPVVLERAHSVRLFNVQAPSAGIRSGPRFDGDVLFVNTLFRVGSGPRQILPLEGPGTVTLVQPWFQWPTEDPAPRNGVALLLIHGRLRLEGGVVLDVASRQPGGRPWEPLGTLLNPEFFPQELALPAARAVAAPRPFGPQPGPH
jgi:hypothetical protein